jgi:hypothetical protein
LKAVRKRMLYAVCAFLIVIPPSIAFAESFNYVDSAIFGSYQTGETSGSTARQFNTVWRPVGNTFRLYYSSSGVFDWYNTWSNPFTVNTSINDAYAGCQNYQLGTTQPVTCQTTRP